MKPSNPTRDKLEESIHYYEELIKYYQDDKKFNWSLSAFLSAFRSITLFLQKQYTKHEGFKAWYSDFQNRMKADCELSFMNDARVSYIHKESKELGATRQGEIKIRYALAGSGKATTPIIKKLEVDNQVKTTKRYFVEFKEEDILTLTSKQIEKMEIIVNECEDRFLKQ